MKTLIVGFKDAKGLGEEVLVCGAHVPQADQVKLMSDAKTKGNYPQGLVRLEFRTVETHNVAIKITNNEPNEPKKGFKK